MKKTFDIKSALMGASLAAIVLLAVGAAASKHPQAGRYQIGGTASHAIIVDTNTGQAWSSYLSQNGGKRDSNFWKPKGNQ
ncbi:hypothetical protein N9B57_01675 [Verrucomicrobia bacterium]|jgi:hypothetical protein|nr:hypothetical protein [Verrucomicrobiota bacterium]MDA7866621.1 hypothetical protein [Verrucomicrobiota bacterium]